MMVPACHLPLTSTLAIRLGARVPNVSVGHDDIDVMRKKEERQRKRGKKREKKTK
jgi:hypothetical protein